MSGAGGLPVSGGRRGLWRRVAVELRRRRRVAAGGAPLPFPSSSLVDLCFPLCFCLPDTFSSSRVRATGSGDAATRVGAHHAVLRLFLRPSLRALSSLVLSDTVNFYSYIIPPTRSVESSPRAWHQWLAPEHKRSITEAQVAGSSTRSRRRFRQVTRPTHRGLPRQNAAMYRRPNITTRCEPRADSFCLSCIVYNSPPAANPAAAR